MVILSVWTGKCDKYMQINRASEHISVQTVKCPTYGPLWPQSQNCYSFFAYLKITVKLLNLPSIFPVAFNNNLEGLVSHPVFGFKMDNCIIKESCRFCQKQLPTQRKKWPVLKAGINWNRLLTPTIIVCSLDILLLPFILETSRLTMQMKAGAFVPQAMNSIKYAWLPFMKLWRLNSRSKWFPAAMQKAINIIS